MKALKLFVSLLFTITFFAVNVNAQEKLKNKDDIYFIVEEMPEYPGGENVLRDDIANEVKYPKEAVTKCIQGKVYVTFIVNEEGKVSDATIARGVDPLLDKEALRVVSILKTWTPGKEKGKAVKVSYTVPINFALGYGKATETSNEVTAKKDGDVFFIVEEMPEFPGGDEALRKFIVEKVKYPEEAQKNGIQGKVYVTFVVAEDGSVIRSKIARGVDPSLDKEALRVINSLPIWKPGKQRGQTVKVAYTVPINFALNDDK
ncbi:TonB family protein [Prolixibacteraceae bacterium Z1-6]|uniref:TonB family protein n=1 Tax=Draconibacterium aestuarii TaxID=2998507 RepID=A0A9X3J653_9BACT|nr:TonB family protein [Prolixibacteraceae bacterium Z1-6]